MRQYIDPILSYKSRKWCYREWYWVEFLRECDKACSLCTTELVLLFIGYLSVMFVGYIVNCIYKIQYHAPSQTWQTNPSCDCSRQIHRVIAAHKWPLKQNLKIWFLVIHRYPVLNSLSIELRLTRKKGNMPNSPKRLTPLEFCLLHCSFICPTVSCTFVKVPLFFPVRWAHVLFLFKLMSLGQHI
jgi:hypothetical protein